jgi:hypothetical protein
MRKETTAIESRVLNRLLGAGTATFLLTCAMFLGTQRGASAEDCSQYGYEVANGCTETWESEMYDSCADCLHNYCASWAPDYQCVNSCLGAGSSAWCS